MLESLDSEKPLCLAVFDIDHFKNFNDTYGHRAGDFVLARTANMLQSSTREGRRDSVYRYGGEEFCMLLPDTTVDEAAHLVDGFRQSIESADFDFEGRRLKVTISAGLAHCPNSGSSPDTLFTAADNALYGAKNAGLLAANIIGAFDEELGNAFFLTGRVHVEERLAVRLTFACMLKPTDTTDDH